jgi:hypothetical protein
VSQVLFKKGQKLNPASSIPRDSERTISYPLMLHRFQNNVQMLDLGFLRSFDHRDSKEVAGDMNHIVGVPNLLFVAFPCNIDNCFLLIKLMGLLFV